MHQHFSKQFRLIKLLYIFF